MDSKTAFVEMGKYTKLFEAVHVMESLLAECANAESRANIAKKQMNDCLQALAIAQKELADAVALKQKNDAEAPKILAEAKAAAAKIIADANEASSSVFSKAKAEADVLTAKAKGLMSGAEAAVKQANADVAYAKAQLAEITDKIAAAREAAKKIFG